MRAASASSPSNALMRAAKPSTSPTGTRKPVSPWDRIAQAGRCRRGASRRGESRADRSGAWLVRCRRTRAGLPRAPAPARYAACVDEVLVAVLELMMPDLPSSSRIRSRSLSIAHSRLDSPTRRSSHRFSVLGVVRLSFGCARSEAEAKSDAEAVLQTQHFQRPQRKPQIVSPHTTRSRGGS
jgi:hypothetical protein